MDHLTSKRVEELSREFAAMRGVIPTDLHHDLRNRLTATNQFPWLFYKNLPVTSFPLMLDETGQHLQAREIEVFATDVYWRYGTNFANVVTSPSGFNQVADNSWRFPGLNIFQIVLYQPAVEAFGVNSNNPSAPQRITTHPGVDFLVGVNDVTDTYYDNTGAFSLWVHILSK